MNILPVPSAARWLLCALLVTSVGHAGGITQLDDLPLIEVPAHPANLPGPTEPSAPLAILLTGDGGWAPLDRQISAQLAAADVPVVGLNLLRYFWKARTPEETARDMTRILEHYMRVWSRQRAMLIGYSRGADVLPFIVNRLPAELRNQLTAIVLIGLGDRAGFQIRIREMLPGAASAGEAIEPEARRLDLSRVLCLYGSGERDSLCQTLAGAGAHAMEIGSGHHLGGHYDTIAQQILGFPPALRER